MDRVDDSDEVNVECVDKALIRNVIALWADSCVRHDNVQTTQLCNGVVQRRFETCAVAHVDDSRDDTLTGLLDELRCFVQVLASGKGYSLDSMSAQMSTAMMSAPSSARWTAWLRPCPRAAPVTSYLALESVHMCLR